jgi:pyruvate/2-oxoglutarate dehydrogenase complex dihydrolipoamide acyltransferase (E2) component
MATPITAPRLDANDDFVSVTSILVEEGQAVKREEPLLELETTKAVMSVEAESDGYVLKLACAEGDQVAVGAVLLWFGERPDETVPESFAGQVPAAAAPEGGPTGHPTMKALKLLQEHGIEAEAVPRSGERLTAQDVMAYLGQAKASGAADPARSAQASGPVPSGLAPGRIVTLTPQERGMLNTVLWHREQAAATYLERAYDPAPWAEFARDFASRHSLFLDPLLALMTYRMVRAAADRPEVNATIVNGEKYLYDHVNPGFTIRTQDALYLAVVHRAEGLDALDFVQALFGLQKRAMGHKLRPEETQAATIAFSSLAATNVSRHVPVLPPYASLMVSHASPDDGPDANRAVLGATYDHRMVDGYGVATFLQTMTTPPGKDEWA